MTKRPVIAVVDDDEVYTEMIRDFLDGEGFDTLTIREAALAVDAIIRARPALVLLDVRMDASDSGIDILAALRSRPEAAGIPVVVCTADQQFLRANQSLLHSHVATSLGKPFDLDVLLDTIRRTLSA